LYLGNGRFWTRVLRGLPGRVFTYAAWRRNWREIGRVAGLTSDSETSKTTYIYLKQAAPSAELTARLHHLNHTE